MWWTLCAITFFGVAYNGNSIWDKEPPGGKWFTPEHLFEMGQGPFDQGPVKHSAGTWWCIDLESTGIREMMKDVGDAVADPSEKVDLQTAYHGSNLAALSSIWSSGGVYSL